MSSLFATLTGPTAFGDNWQAQSVCGQVDPEVWFPEKGGNPAPAKRACAVCPVRVLCLGTALVGGEPFGVWGGLTVAERRALTTYQRRVAIAAAQSFARDDTEDFLAAA